MLAVYHGKIPPSLFFEKPNPRLGLEDSPFYVNNVIQDWVTSGHPRRAGVSSFGVGGTNAHVVVEQPPRVTPASSSGFPRIVCVSAKNADTVNRQAESLQRCLAAHESSMSLDSVSFTLQNGREPMQHRAAWAVQSVADAANALADKRRVIRGKATGSRRIAFMFTGQGSQRARMGQWLYDNNGTFRRCFDEGAEYLLKRNGFDIRSMLFSDPTGTESEVDQTRNAQPALFLLEYSLARTLESMGLAADTVLGHSVGEFVAATLAGIFTYEDAICVVAKRGELMQSMPRGSMLAVYCGEAEVRSYLSSDICLAAVNAPELSVLSGPDAAIEALAAELESKGARSKRLRTSHAFHSAMMDPAVDAMRSVLSGVTLSAPMRPIISTVSGNLLSNHEATSPEYWARQLRETVRFAPALNSLAEMGEFALLEVGPGSALTTLALQHERVGSWAAIATLPGCGLQEGAALEVLAAVAHCWVHGAPVDWKRQWNDSKPQRIPLPTYPFASVRYWLDPPQSSVAPATAVQSPETISQTSSNMDATAMNMETTAMNDSNRFAGLQDRVIKVLEETSGYDLQDAAKDANFLELGFDSLLLTQISTALKSAFGVPVTFRALMEEFTSIRELTEHLGQGVARGGGARGGSCPREPDCFAINTVTTIVAKECSDGSAILVSRRGEIGNRQATRNYANTTADAWRGTRRVACSVSRSVSARRAHHGRSFRRGQFGGKAKG